MLKNFEFVVTKNGCRFTGSSYTMMTACRVLKAMRFRDSVFFFIGHSLSSIINGAGRIS